MLTDLFQFLVRVAFLGLILLVPLLLLGMVAVDHLFAGRLVLDVVVAVASVDWLRWRRPEGGNNVSNLEVFFRDSLTDPV